MNKSFTLIEILVVIVVIGILSSFILVGMSSIVTDASRTKLKKWSDSLDNMLLTNKVSQWKLDGNANDSWGVNNGTLVGATHLPVAKTESECVSGTCYQFDGTEDYIDFGSDSSLAMRTRDHTASIWVKFDNALAPQDEALLDCVSASPLRGYYLRRASGTARLYLNFYLAGGGVGTYVSPVGSVINSTWYNIVVAMDRDVFARIYLNSSLQSGGLTISAYQGDLQSVSSFKIGATSSSSNRFAGIIDEVRIYHEILSSELINQEYYSGVNSLLVKNQIDNNDYVQRLTVLKYNISQNYE